MIYHYTKAVYLPSILTNGLKQSDVGVNPPEKPVVWFTINPAWENTVFAIDAPSLEKAHARMLGSGGLARIVCNDAVAPHTWKDLKELANIPSKIAISLYQSALAVSSKSSEWRGTLDWVPLKHSQESMCSTAMNGSRARCRSISSRRLRRAELNRDERTRRPDQIGTAPSVLHGNGSVPLRIDLHRVVVGSQIVQHPVNKAHPLFLGFGIAPVGNGLCRIGLALTT